MSEAEMAEDNGRSINQDEYDLGQWDLENTFNFEERVDCE